MARLLQWENGDLLEISLCVYSNRLVRCEDSAGPLRDS